MHLKVQDQVIVVINIIINKSICALLVYIMSNIGTVIYGTGV